MKATVHGGFSLKKYIKGYILACLITIIIIAVMSVVLSFVDIGDEMALKAASSMKYISAALSGFLCARGGKKRGFLTGGVASLVYMLLLCAAGLLLFQGKNANPYIIRQLITGTLCGAVGGIAGINCKK